MGNSSPRPHLADAAVNFQADLPKFILQSKIGNGKLMKTYLMRCESNSVVVKVYMSYPDEDLRTFASELTRIWYTISPSRFPNLLPYQLWMKSTSRYQKSPGLPIYLIRQYLYSNLHDRISTRPFLIETEKLWVLYQMFLCVEKCHELQIVHGDIKPENILCTTSNWIVLTDFAVVKPVNVPDDNPSDFQYFFDSMGRPRCYIAPERFCNQFILLKKRGSVTGASPDRNNLSPLPTSSPVSLLHQIVSPLSSSRPSFDRGSSNALLSDSVFGDAATAIRSQAFDTVPSDNYTAITGSEKDKRRSDDKESSSGRLVPSSLLPSMDVFSLGCTIAEVLLDGEPFLDLPGMLKYANRNRPTSQSSERNSSTNTDSNSPIAMNHLDVQSSPARGALDRIGAGVGHSQLKKVIVHMTQRDAEKRLSISEYRNQLELSEGAGEASFPAYFSAALYPLFLRMHWEGVGPDQRVAILCESYGDLTESMTGERDDTGHTYLKMALRQSSSGDDKEKDNDKGDSSYSPSPLPGGEVKQPFCPSPTSTPAPIPIDVGSSVGSSDALSDVSTQELLLRCQQAIADAETRFRQVPFTFSASASDVSVTDISKVCPPVGIDSRAGRENEPVAAPASGKRDGSTVFGSGVLIGSTQSPVHSADMKRRGRGIVILVQVVTANFRHLSLPRSKIASVILLVRLGLCSHDDEVLLRRVLPCLLLALADPSSAVRALSIRALTAVLSNVTAITSFEGDIFPQYLFAPLSTLARDGETPVRIAFAECLGALAETARRFLEMAHLMAMTQSAADNSALNKSAERKSSAKGAKDDRTDTLLDAPVQSNTAPCGPVLAQVQVQFPYDYKLKILHDQVTRWMRDVSSTGLSHVGQKGTDPATHPYPPLTCATAASMVKRVLLNDIGRLCTFFGQEATTDLLLTQILTYLNDQDWELRLAFCEKIPIVCVFLGNTVTSECILPFLENALADSEERVVVQSVRCITSLVQLSLLSRLMTVDAVKSAAPLLLHPRHALRHVTLSLVQSAGVALGSTDSAVFLLPLLRPALAHPLNGTTLTARTISDALVEPLSWNAYRRALADRQHALSKSDPLRDPLLNEVYSPNNRTSDTVKRSSNTTDAPHTGGLESFEMSDAALNDSWIVSASPTDVSNDYEEDYGIERDPWFRDGPSIASSSSAAAAADRPNSAVSLSEQREVDSDTGRIERTDRMEREQNIPITVTPFEDASEPSKIHYIRPYMDQVAREHLSRAAYGHSQGQHLSHELEEPSLPSNVPRNFEGSDDDVIRRRFRSLSLGLLHITRTPSLAATGLSENLTHSLSIPRQKYGNAPPVPLGFMSGVVSQMSVPSTSASALSSMSVVSPVSISEADRNAVSSLLSQPMSEVKLAKGVQRATLHSLFGIQTSNTSAFPRNRSAGTLSSARQPQISSMAVNRTSLTNDTRQPVVSTTKEGDNDNDRDREGEREEDEGSRARSAQADIIDSNILNGEIVRTRVLVSRLRALKVPPLPPDLGSLQRPDGKPFSSFLETLDQVNDSDSYSTSTATHGPSLLRSDAPLDCGSPPPPLSLMCVLTEHTAAVSRLAVSPDHSFFASGSADGCVKIWQLKGLDKAAFPRSSITYSGHAGGVTDLCVIENSHSVASSSTDGQVHVWRIELASSSSKKRSKDIKEGSAVGGMQTGGTVGASTQSQSIGLSVRALSVVRCINPYDGRVTALQHCTGNVSSIVVYCTQKGSVVGWDLRCAGEAFRYTVRPEFGVPTCIALASDSNSCIKGSVVVGTSRGYLLMWDSRFDLMIAAWRHSCNGPIHQVSCIQSRISLGDADNYPYPSFSLSPSSPLEEDDDAYDTLDMDNDIDMETQRDSVHIGKIGSDSRSKEYLAIAAGCNEASIWYLPIQSSGAAVRCFRATSVSNSRNKLSENDASRLISVSLPSHPHTTVQQAISSLLSPFPSPSSTSVREGNHSIRSFLVGNADGNKPYLLTGGSDGYIRHWDWTTPTRCGVLVGLAPAQHKPAIVNVRIPRLSRVGGDSVGGEEHRNSGGTSGGGGIGGGGGERMDGRTKHSGSVLSNMFVCYDTYPPSPFPSTNTAYIAQAHLPLRDSKGTTNTSNASTSAVLDLKCIEAARKLLVSCSDDGTIKLWR